MTAAAIYARYSSTNQRDASIEDQLRICREYCDKNGLTAVQEYCDHALTGRTDQRPAFLRMVSDAEKRAFSVLVLYAMDRLSRDKFDLVYYKRRLAKAGVKIVYVTQPIGDGAEARLMESLLEGMAAYYSENLARSVRRGLEGNALKGIVTTGRAPFGYRLTAERRLEPDPVAAPHVKTIFERYARGDSRTAIIADLNAQGVKTTLGNPFKTNSLDTVLKNDVYTGVFRWAQIRIENDHTPLITPALYQEVQQMLKRKAQSKTALKPGDDFYLLTGKFFCAECGAWIVGECGTARSGAVHHYYMCSGRKHGKGCASPRLKKDETEQRILTALVSALTDDAIEEISRAAEQYAAHEAERDDPRPALRARLKDTETRLKNLMAAIEQGIITPTTKQRLTELESDRAALTAQLARAELKRPRLTAPMFAAFLRPLQHGDLSDPAYRSRLIQTLLARATLTKDKKIALLLNLKSNATLNLDGSTLTDQVGITRLRSNRIYVVRGCVLYCIII